MFVTSSMVQEAPGCLYIRAVIEKGCLAKFINGKLLLTAGIKTGIGVYAVAGVLSGIIASATGAIETSSPFCVIII